MPVDKFGRHFLRTSAYDSKLKHDSICFPTSTPFYICQHSQLHSKCIIKFSGQKVSSKHNPAEELVYLLDNYKDAYTMPVTGKVESIQVYPSDTKITVNDLKPPQSSSFFIGKQLMKGEQLSFLAKDSKSFKEKLQVELVLQCSLQQNES